MYPRRYLPAAVEAIARCRLLALDSEEPEWTTRTFLSEPMHAVHSRLQGWMDRAGMTISIDHAGNLRARYPAQVEAAPRLLIGSHLDTVPHAGAFDGVLGVVLGLALIELMAGRRLRFHLELVGFSEEEGVRYGVPFIGSRALIGDMPAGLLATRDAAGISVSETIRRFGLDPARIPEARVGGDALGYLEFHIEQGPVLEGLDVPLGVVEAIAGQSRLEVRFDGRANHAGTTPMHARSDALAGAAEWIGATERHANETPGLVATVGRLEAIPGASNVIAGCAKASLDVRHARDTTRHTAVEVLLDSAGRIASRRGLKFSWEQRLDQAAVAMDASLVETLQFAVETAGYPAHHMISGAGHDAMIMARHMPAAMLFLRSPGGISHHPDENVIAEDVAAALETGMHFLDAMEARLA